MARKRMLLHELLHKNAEYIETRASKDAGLKNAAVRLTLRAS